MTKLETEDYLLIEQQIMKHYSLNVKRRGAIFYIEVPKFIGYGIRKKDKYELVEELALKISDNIRQYRKVFDVDFELTDEEIKLVIF